MVLIYYYLVESDCINNAILHFSIIMCKIEEVEREGLGTDKAAYNIIMQRAFQRWRLYSLVPRPIPSVQD